jgi:hypothetical protein
MTDFDISQERNEYAARETAKGTLVISTVFCMFVVVVVKSIIINIIFRIFSKVTPSYVFQNVHLEWHNTMLSPLFHSMVSSYFGYISVLYFSP